MVADFRFNGQTSYSPLLAALAQAPAERIKLGIAQEKNNRERLSSLLTNMSNAAQLARTFQQQKAITKQSELAGGVDSVGGNASLIDPSGFASLAGRLPATMLGINSSFPMIQPPQTQGQPSFQSATPGSVPISPGAGVLNPEAIRNKLILNATLGEPKQVTDQNTGTQFDSYGPDMNIPIFGGGKAEGVDGKPQLPPKLMEAANTAKEKFQSRADIAANISDLNLLDQIEGGVKSGNPAAIQNLIIERARTGGLPGGRVTSGTQAAEVGNQQFGAKIGRYWKKIMTGNLTEADRADFLDQIQNQRNVSAKQIIDAHGSTASEVAKQYGIALPIAKKIIGSGLESQMSRYNPKYKPLYKSTASKEGSVDMGGGFSYTVNP